VARQHHISRCIGGAGTGKTQTGLGFLTAARSDLRLSPSEVGFSTFTVNGRRVMAQRAAEAWGCDETSLTKDGFFRTTHSTAMRQLGVTTEELLTNDPASRESIRKALRANVLIEKDDFGMNVFSPQSSEDREAALSLALWQKSRNTLQSPWKVLQAARDRKEPTPSADAFRHFVTRYESYKRTHGLTDFCDLLARYAGVFFDLEGHKTTRVEGRPPEGLRAVVIDEAQDASALVDLCCQRIGYGPDVERVLLIGDPNQSLYGFGGGSPKHFLNWPVDHEWIMPQSYRCPAPVMEFGEKCLRQLRNGEYRDRNIAPAPHEGKVVWVRHLEDALASHVDYSQPTLILARCRHTLMEYARILDRAEIPFGYLDREQPSGIPVLYSLWCLERGKPVPTVFFAKMVADVRNKHPDFGSLLESGTKKRWEIGENVLCRRESVTKADLPKAGCTPALIALIESGNWKHALTQGHRMLYERWLPAVTRYGVQLACEPQVKLSTIHAAKGAEADCVLVSAASSRQISTSSSFCPESWNEECRVAYVAATRAREKLVIVEDARRDRLLLPSWSD
jgi:superfamily I DNA/RNA helicase